MKHIYQNVIICLLIGASFVGCSKKVDNQNPIVPSVRRGGLASHLLYAKVDPRKE